MIEEKVTKSDDDILLYGADPMERIVALEIVGKQAVIFCRAEDGRLFTRREPFVPFFLLADKEWLPTATSGAYTVVPLNGGGEMKFLVQVDDWSRMWGLVGAVVSACNERHGTRYTSWRDVPGLHVITWPDTQHLISTGKSFFKNMPFEDLHRLQLDLEVLCPAHSHFPNPDDPQAAIIIAALSDNRGWCELIDLREMTEEELLKRTVEVIRAKDPDVIEGHNLLSFDLPYLIRRCERYGVKAALGRNQSEPQVMRRANAKSMRPFAPEDIHIYGRHIVDTLPLVKNRDPANEMASHTLKAAAIHFGLAPEDRTYIDGDQIPQAWHDDPERLLAYARDDVMETEALARLLSLPLYYQAQMVPMTYERLISSGVTTRLEALFMREHVRTHTAVPIPDPAEPFAGAFTHTYIRGLVRNVLYVDVHSLYPSIIASSDICPLKDELRLIPRCVRALLARRLAAKSAASTAEDPLERRRQLAISDSFKNVVNSIYGYLGFGAGLWNDPSQAERVTAIGRDVITSIIDFVRTSGGQPVEADTDGLYFVPPRGVVTPGEQEKYVGELSAALPAGISAGLQGRYEAMLSHADKNYALLDLSGKVIIHGSALRSQGLEPYLRDFLREAITHMLHGRFETVLELHRDMRKRICEKTAPLEWFARSDRLRDSLAEYQRKIEQGQRGRNAAYELAARCGNRFTRGDRIRYYFTGRSGRLEFPKLAEEFDADKPDYSVSRYSRRLDEVMEMLKSMFPEEKRLLMLEGQLDLFG